MKESGRDWEEDGEGVEEGEVEEVEPVMRRRGVSAGLVWFGLV